MPRYLPLFFVSFLLSATTTLAQTPWQTRQEAFEMGQGCIELVDWNDLWFNKDKKKKEEPEQPTAFGRLDLEGFYEAVIKQEHQKRSADIFGPRDDLYVDLGKDVPLEELCVSALFDKR